jgi:hypothetical protein
MYLLSIIYNVYIYIYIYIYITYILVHYVKLYVANIQANKMFTLDLCDNIISYLYDTDIETVGTYVCCNVMPVNCSYNWNM